MSNEEDYDDDNDDDDDDDDNYNDDDNDDDDNDAYRPVLILTVTEREGRPFTIAAAISHSFFGLFISAAPHPFYKDTNIHT